MTRVRFLGALSAVSREQWNALDPVGHPFVRHEFLSALEATGSLQPQLGWRAHHLTIWEGDRLVAGAPCYLKANSHGEFVFDHAWAHACEQAGMAYYPKLLCAVPYTPVSGPRLMGDARWHPDLARALLDEAARLDLSGVHVNFARDEDLAALDDPWLARGDWQFHWRNDGYPDFDRFLAELTSKRRKEIRRERARVVQDGWRIERRTGATLTLEDLRFVHQCYALQFIDKGNYPALTESFFLSLLETMPESLLAVIAWQGSERQAMALSIIGPDVLYGRYWGARALTPGLHFECCYYQGIEFCIERGLARFEPGAQGEHKIARGFLPVRTHSRHHLTDPRLHGAVARSLVREARWLEQYGDTLRAQSPFAERAS